LRDKGFGQPAGYEAGVQHFPARSPRRCVRPDSVAAESPERRCDLYGVGKAGRGDRNGNRCAGFSGLFPFLSINKPLHAIGVEVVGIFFDDLFEYAFAFPCAPGFEQGFAQQHFGFQFIIHIFVARQKSL